MTLAACKATPAMHLVYIGLCCWPATVLLKLLSGCLELQSCGLVPIVEPELLIDGDHTLERFAAASEEVITCCVQHLKRRHVCLEACLLKLQMVIPGTDCIQPKPTPQQIAQQTFDVMQRSAGVAPQFPALAMYTRCIQCTRSRITSIVCGSCKSQLCNSGYSRLFCS